MLSVIHGICVSAFCIVLLAVSITDVLAREVPNTLCVYGIASWLVDAVLQACFGSMQFVVNGVIGGVALAGMALACSLALDRIAGGESLGGGDVKLLFPIGLFAGLLGGVAALGIACVLALAYCAVRAVAKHPVNSFPFVPFLSAGFYFAAAYFQFI